LVIVKYLAVKYVEVRNYFKISNIKMSNICWILRYIACRSLPFNNSSRLAVRHDDGCGSIVKMPFTLRIIRSLATSITHWQLSLTWR